ncbi:MAG: hypothetical protein V3575_06340 [Candidatus Absconditabacteria bacterium]
MQTYDQSVSQFSQLTYENKKKKVVAMLDILREEGNVFSDLWDLVHVNEDVSEGIIDMIYQVITKAMYSIREQEMEDAVERLEKLKGKMSEIREQEKAETESADDILSQI